MEECKTMTINTATHPPKLWLRCVDDTLVIQKAEYSIHFLQHINSIDPHAQFNQEAPNTDGSIPFLDTLVSPGPNNNLLTTVYRKSTHPGQHLYWNSQHNLSSMYSVFNTLTHRARTVCANTQLLHKKATTGTTVHRSKTVPVTISPTTIKTTIATSTWW